MRSLPQFTRSTRWGEFTWVGAIIFEGNFMVSGQFSGGGGAVLLGGNCTGDNFPLGQLAGGQHSGGNCPGTIIRWAIFPSGNFLDTEWDFQFLQNSDKNYCKIRYWRETFLSLENADVFKFIFLLSYFFIFTIVIS